MELSSIQKEILKLKYEKKALVLAHYYVPLDVQDTADFVCDSFEMAKRARDAENQLIVICGVRFMGESAKILSPDKKILLPSPEAGCPMADMVSADDVAQLKKAHPEAAVMCYVNSSASVKAVSDVCCTSSSALRIARSLKEHEIIFVPDKNLGAYIAEKVPEKKLILFTGYCPAHNKIREADVTTIKSAHPKALFAAHPECGTNVLRHADFIGSTSEIIDFAKTAGADEIIIGTEMEITSRLAREMPEKTFYSVTPDFVCGDMKKINLEALKNCLENETFEVSVDKEEAEGALRSLDRMVNC